MLKVLIRAARELIPPRRMTGLDEELRFWDNWLATRGDQWPQDFENRLDPALALQDDIREYVDQLPADVIRIADVGAGPLTKLGKIHPTKRLSIVPTDVLAEQYGDLLRKHDITPIVPTRYADAERLSEHLGPGTFDMAYAQNCVDHMRNPVRAIEEIVRIVKPGGFVVLKHAEREGAEQRYHGLHQWDFFLQGGELYLQGRSGSAKSITAIMGAFGVVHCRQSGRQIVAACRKRACESST